MVASNPVNQVLVPQGPSALDSSVTSTNYNPAVAMQSLFPLASITYSNNQTQQKRDYLAQMSRKIKNIRKCVPYNYKGYETLTTDIFNLYGATTYVWIFLLYNGVHRLELVPGVTYKMPDVSEIQQFINPKAGSQTSNVGKTITIR